MKLLDDLINETEEMLQKVYTMTPTQQIAFDLHRVQCRCDYTKTDGLRINWESPRTADHFRHYLRRATGLLIAVGENLEMAKRIVQAISLD